MAAQINDLTTRPKRIRILGISLPILYLLAVLMLIGTVFILSNNDPLVLYYGVHLPKSQLHQYVSQRPQPPQGLYCIQIAPFAFVFNDLFTCFDTQTELNDYALRRAEIRANLSPNP